MKKALMILLSLLLVCMSMQTAFAADYDVRLNMKESDWEYLKVHHDVEDGTIEFRGGDTMILKKSFGSYIMKHEKEFTDAKIRFFIKYDNLSAESNDNVFDIYLRDHVPEKGCWDIEDHSYALRFCTHPEGTKAFFTTNNEGYPNQFTRNDKGGYMIKDFLGKRSIEPGRFYEFVIGAVNENGNVRLTLTIDGELMINILDTSETRITAGAYFCIANLAKADLTIKMADKTPRTTTTRTIPRPPTGGGNQFGTTTATPIETTTDGGVTESNENDSTEPTTLENGDATTGGVTGTSGTGTKDTGGPDSSGSLTTILIICGVVLLLAAAGVAVYFLLIKKRNKETQ